jgi:Protein of unknown function (DUF1761)
MHLPPINWLAVFVAAVVIFGLGALWYSPVLFMKKWLALQGRTEEQMRAQAASANMPVMYVSAFVTALITAAVLALVLAHFDRSIELTWAHGALFGFLFWLGFAATTSYATALFSGKPKQLWFIDTMYNLVSFMIAGIIIAVWR